MTEDNSFVKTPTNCANRILNNVKKNKITIDDIYHSIEKYGECNTNAMVCIIGMSQVLFDDGEISRKEFKDKTKKWIKKLKCNI